MLQNLKLKLVAAAALLFSSTAFAGLGNLPGDGSVGNPYDFGSIGSTPTTLAVTLIGTTGDPFEEYANFTIPSFSSTTGSAATLFLSLGGHTTVDINNFLVEVWDDVHPNGSSLIATFTDDGLTHALGNLAPGQYHLDISGVLGADLGQYAVSLQALPVPEPETYAMLLAGLGLIGFSLRRRSA
jgi:hypothetical protein